MCQHSPHGALHDPIRRAVQASLQFPGVPRSRAQDLLQDGGPLPSRCRHPEYLKELLALLTSYYEGVLGMAGASGLTAPRALALSCTPKKPYPPGDPPPADPGDEPAPALAGSAGAQEPASAASPPKAGGKGGVRARGGGK